MARPPRFNISAVQNLLEQLRYAPAETRRREMEAAERFLAEIDPDQTYPEDYLIFRVTSYRPNVDEPAMLIGKALIRDLAVFIERLSDSLALTTDDYQPRQAMTLEEAANRLGVSVSTLTRYRRLGLVAHQIVWPDHRKRLGFFEDAVQRFIDLDPERTKKARAFEHLDEAQKQRLLKRARRYESSLGLTLNEAARRLATTFARTPEAVRQLLKRHDESNQHDAIFHERGPLTDRERSVLWRAHRRGVPMRFMVRRVHRSRPAIYRAIHQERALVLRRMQLKPVTLPTFSLEDAESILLSPYVVRDGLAPPASLGGDALTWIESIHTQTEPLAEDQETALFGAMNYLLHWCATERERIDRHHPSARQLDEIETRLRWAARIKTSLIAWHLPDILATIEIHLGHQLLDSPGSQIRSVHTQAIQEAILACDQFNPSRGQRFAVLLRFRLRQAFARIASPRALQARAKLTIGRVFLDDPSDAVFAWQRDVDLSRTLADRVLEIGVDDPGMELLAMRYGLRGQAPQTCIAIASKRNLPDEQVARAEWIAIRRLHRIGYERASKARQNG